MILEKKYYIYHNITRLYTQLLKECVTIIIIPNININKIPRGCKYYWCNNKNYLI